VSAPSIRTARLDLRPLSMDDLDEMAEVFAEVAVWRYPYQRGFSREETRAFLVRHGSDWEQAGYGLWGVRALAGGPVHGYVGLSVPNFLPEVLPAVEVGWRLHPRVWGRGWATEAAAAALAYAFAPAPEGVGLDRVVSIFEPENVASGRVMARLGLTFDRATVHPVRGEDLEVRAIDRETWLARAATGDGGGSANP
jgi:RimJ/RimL family protein N-acetyltransferase